MLTYRSSAPIGKCIHQLLVVQAFRPDRLTAMGSKFVAKVMGEVFQQEAETELDLGTIVNTEVKDESSPSLLPLAAIIQLTLPPLPVVFLSS